MTFEMANKPLSVLALMRCDYYHNNTKLALNEVLRKYDLQGAGQLIATSQLDKIFSFTPGMEFKN